jgi:tRNA dimethylallyltransferase
MKLNRTDFVAPLVAVVGETASGKTALTLALAQKFGGEIICADSWTVRREVNIGTAKPSYEEQKLIPHHLLGVVGPCEDFTAAVFKQMANESISDIASRGKIPFLSGGTGLYVDGVLFDYSFLPAGDRGARGQFDAITAEQLVVKASSLGLSTEGIDTQNKRRIIRLIETNGGVAKKQSLRKNTLYFGLRLPKEQLEARIVQRVDSMLAAGLEAEVKQLAERYGWDCEALKGIGYAQWQDYFAGKSDLGQTRERIIRATMQLAKRQRTWFKRHQEIHWVSNQAEAEQLISQWLAHEH